MKTTKQKFTLSRDQFKELLTILDDMIKLTRNGIEGQIAPMLSETAKKDLEFDRRNLRALYSLRREMRSLL